MSSPLTLMVQGTASDAGKSTLVAGLARALRRRALKVAPFKPQNMASNVALTADGGQIGRAQAVQAIAAGLAPHSDFNPVLLKPGSDVGAEVIIHGRSVGNMSAADFHAFKPTAKAAVMESWARLCAQYEALLVEGAGSPAEINLRAGDIANMGFAEAADVPVVLVADIDRGGVFAHLVGTLELLTPSEQARVRGFVINRFRGDLSLLQPGLEWLEERTGRKVFGVLPYLQGLFLDAEDRLAQSTPRQAGEPRLRVVAPAYPRISNHTDADPLRLHPQLDFRWVRAGEPMPPADLILLLGSLSVQSDLAWLRAQGWEERIRRHLRYGGKLLGICGGFQMLGRTLSDPLGLEGPPATVAGLSWLKIDTVLVADRLQGPVSGRLAAAVAGAATSVAVKGYEIHHGRSSGEGLRRAALQLERDGSWHDDGALSADGQVLGTYVHGLFDEPAALASLLRWAGLEQATALASGARREAELERLADVVEEHCDLDALFDQRLSGTMPT